MSATNSTPIINLPLFIGTDKPAWLTDWNGAMNIIDTAIANLQTAESGTATSLASLAQSVEALSGTVSQHTTAIQTVTTATAGNTGSINTINSLIGNGLPTTDDKTIIGAINEIYAEIGGGDGVDADEVNYNNATSGLTATNVQAAIDELAQSGPSSVDADDVAYDNTQSGLTATNVQAAIDEVVKYSPTESVIGKWIDGKDIYRRVITGNFSIAGSTNFVVDSTLTDTDVDTLIGIKGSMYFAASNQMNQLGTANNGAFLSTTGVNVWHTSSSTQSTDLVIVIEYTKATP